MNQHRISWIWLALIGVVVVSLLAAACELPSTATTGGTTKPIVVIVTPANGSQVPVGQPTAIQIVGTDAAGVTRIEIKIDGALVGTAQSQTAQGQPSLTATQDWTFAQAGSHVIAAQAFNAAGQASDAATITVQAVASVAVQPTNTIPPPATPVPTPLPGAPIVKSFTANPASITAGQSVTLQWEVTGATTVDIQPGIGAVALSGSRSVSPAATTTYYLTAQGPGGKTPATVKVTVQAAPPGKPVIKSFTANPASITAGQSATLLWEVTGATAVTIDHGVGGVALSGSKSVSPPSNVIYTLTAQGPGGTSTAAVEISVTPAAPVAPNIKSFTANPTSITAGSSSTLQWEVTNATSVEIDHGIGAVGLTGSKSVSPGSTTTYKLTAKNSVGVIVKEVTVQVNPKPGINATITYHSYDPASGWTTFRIVNNAGGATLESVRAVIINRSTSANYFGPMTSNTPFRTSPTQTSTGESSLAAGQTRYLRFQLTTQPPPRTLPGHHHSVHRQPNGGHQFRQDGGL